MTRNAGKPVRRRSGERGSALLVVLVFAAIIAIMLYRELPIAAFEAQRQKEELLVARGNEYKRGVKLFVRKIGRFPSTIDELENTNRMRFLRHRFVDPMTGKDDWRLIHAGVGGIITDSKVASTTNGPKAGGLGQAAAFAGFNNSFNGDAAAAAASLADNTPSAGMRQRPPATKNAGSGVSDDPLAAAAGTEDLTNTPNPAMGTTGYDPATGQPLTATGQPLASGSNGTPSTVPGSAAGMNGNAPIAMGNGITMNPALGGGGGNGVTTLADQLNTTNPKTPETGQPTTVVGNQGPTTANQISGGGIAGVASKAEGKSIMLVNEQKKYKLWEFYYDMRKEQQAAAGGGLQQQNPGVNGGNNNGNNTNGNNGSAFGGGSTFGQSQSSFGGGFGSSQSQTPPTTAQQPQTPQNQ